MHYISSKLYSALVIPALILFTATGYTQDELSPPILFVEVDNLDTSEGLIEKSVHKGKMILHNLGSEFTIQDTSFLGGTIRFQGRRGQIALNKYWSPSGNKIVIIYREGTAIDVYDLTGKEPELVCRIDEEFSHGCYLISFNDAEDKLLVAGIGDYRIKIWQLKSPQHPYQMIVQLPKFKFPSPRNEDEIVKSIVGIKFIKGADHVVVQLKNGHKMLVLLPTPLVIGLLNERHKQKQLFWDKLVKLEFELRMLSVGVIPPEEQPSHRKELTQELEQTKSELGALDQREGIEKLVELFLSNQTTKSLSVGEKRYLGYFFRNERKDGRVQIRATQKYQKCIDGAKIAGIKI